MDKSTVETYINEIGKHLTEKRIYGAASLMIGAGFSKNARNITNDGSLPPDWYQLAEKMFDDLYPNNKQETTKVGECSGQNVLALAQKYQVVFGRQKLNRLIERSISDDSFEPTPLFEDLLSLDWEDIYTTNYDTLLERALKKKVLTREYQIIYSCKDLPQSTRPRLIKLHGSVDKSDDYIITEEDYRTYPVKYAPFVNTVQQSMIETQLCLIGFSGSDPNFLNWLGWLRDNLGENCPKIYLCGYFPDMGYAETKVLEKKNIVVVDLSALIEHNDKKTTAELHYEALNEFATRLKKIKNNDSAPLFSYKDYSYDLLHGIDENNLKFIKNKIGDIKQKTSKYVTIPILQNKIIRNYCLCVFDDLCKEKNILNNNLDLASDLAWIIYRCGFLISSNSFENLCTIISEDNVLLNQKVMISLALLKQARILSDINKYDSIFSLLKDLEINDNELSNEITIEKIHRLILDYEYEEVKSLVSKIYDSENAYYMLVKASIYLSLKEDKLASNHLKKAMEFITKNRKLKDNEYASIIGYAKLISSNLSSVYSVREIDELKWFDNSFNTRRVLVDYQENILKEMVKRSYEDNYSFYPNRVRKKYRLNFGTPTKVYDSYSYLNLLDKLCISFGLENKLIVIQAIQDIEQYSNSIYYSWSSVLQITDNKFINNYFTKDRISESSLDQVQHFFDVLEKAVCSETFLSVIQIKNYLNVMARLLTVLDQERISRFISLLINAPKKLNDNAKQVIKPEIEKCIDLIRYFFNEETFNNCLDILVSDELEETYFAIYFMDYRYLPEDYRKINKTRLKETLLDSSKSSNLMNRSSAIAKYLIFYDSLPKSTRRKIIENISLQKDSYGLPNNHCFNHKIWLRDELNNDEISNSLIKYVKNPNLPSKDLADGVILDGVDICSIMDDYDSFLIEWIKDDIDNLNISEDEIIHIFQYFVDYLETYKKGVGITSPLDHDEFFKLLSSINTTIITFLYYVKYCQLESNAINEILAKYKNITTENDLINRITMAKNRHYWDDIEEIVKKKLFSGKIENIKISIRILLLELLFNRNKSICNFVIFVLKSLEICDIETASKIIASFTFIFSNEIILKNLGQKTVVSMLDNYLVRCREANESKKKLVQDFEYNISLLSYKYYENLRKNSMFIVCEFNELISKLKSSSLNEVKNLWTDK